ncbi:MAG: SDR family NAD(P)-dependent oxidoreductase [Candidatus Uhrbacteria bacterium]
MQNILITGIGKGIGAATAEKFLTEGYRVIGTYYRTKPKRQHEHLIEFPLDLANNESIDACGAAIEALDERIDILINNAGVLLDEDAKQVDPEMLRKTLEVNVIGTTRFTERIIPLIREGGHIVNISSTAGSVELALGGKSHFPLHYPCYKISKAALNMYTATLAVRLKENGVTVSAVHPGWVRTEMGGDDATSSPEEAADNVYQVATSRPKTGGFWFQNEHLPW